MANMMEEAALRAIDAVYYIIIAVVVVLGFGTILGGTVLDLLGLIG